MLIQKIVTFVFFLGAAAQSNKTGNFSKHSVQCMSVRNKQIFPITLKSDGK